MDTYKKEYSFFFNNRNFRIQHDDRISKQDIQEWIVLGLLHSSENPTSDDKLQDYYSLLDLIWLSTIADMRDMNIEYPCIKNLKKVLFSNIEPKNKKFRRPTILEYYTALVLELNTPIFIIVNDLMIYIFNDIDYIKFLQSNPKNHICIQLHKQINDVLNQECFVTINFHELSGLPSQEIQLLQIIRNKSSKILTIALNKGKIEYIDSKEKIDSPAKIEELLQEKTCQNLEVKQLSGKIVSAFRISRHKIIS